MDLDLTRWPLASDLPVVRVVFAHGWLAPWGVWYAAGEGAGLSVDEAGAVVAAGLARVYVPPLVATAAPEAPPAHKQVRRAPATKRAISPGERRHAIER